MQTKLDIINGHARNPNWRYLPYMFGLFFRPKCQGISPENMAKHMVQSVPPFSIDLMEINWIWVQVKTKSKKTVKPPKIFKKIYNTGWCPRERFLANLVNTTPISLGLKR